MNDTPGPNIALMKWIVIILGILIVAFTAVIGVKLYTELTATDTDTDTDTAGARSAKTVPSVQSRPSDNSARFEDLEIPLPAGSTVLQITGGQDRLFVHLRSKAGAMEILVIDIDKGQVAGRIKLMPAGDTQ